MSEFSKRLLEERKRLELTQDEFAEIGGISKGTYCNYEGSGSRDRVPDALFLTNIATKAKADVLYILTGIRTPGIAEPKPDYVFVRPDQKSLLDNIEHCSQEDQNIIKRMAVLAAKYADVESEAGAEAETSERKKYQVKDWSWQENQNHPK